MGGQQLSLTRDCATRLATRTFYDQFIDKLAIQSDMISGW